jgi:hypothetical protein
VYRTCSRNRLAFYLSAVTIVFALVLPAASLQDDKVVTPSTLPAACGSPTCPAKQHPVGEKRAWTVASDGCKCYCGGRSWDEGFTACMGGFKYVCANTDSNCGWYPMKSGSDPLRCDGNEHCK